MDFLTRDRPSHSDRTSDPLRGQRGVASVEMIVVLPVLLILLFGTIEFGFIFREQMVLFRAADEATRTLITADDPCIPSERINNAKAAGQAILNLAGIQGSITLEDGVVCTRDTVTMTASSTHQSIVLGALIPPLNTLSLSASSMQRTFQ
jgi:Flp pilus assembly protein TadG